MTTAKSKSSANVSDETSSLPTSAQRKWLQRGLDQAGGKLPLFDEFGRRVSRRLVQSCLDHGWAEPWFVNPLMPNWQVCRLTHIGREIFTKNGKKS